MKGQIDFNEYLKEQHPISTWGGCGQCACKSCLFYWSQRCPYGECFDDKRAKENPYDKAHPDEAPRTSWSNWRTDQAFWCRGSMFYPVYACQDFVKYTGQEVKECLDCNVSVFQDGYISCPLVECVGCEECYRRFEEKLKEQP